MGGAEGRLEPGRAASNLVQDQCGLYSEFKDYLGKTLLQNKKHEKKTDKNRKL